MRVLCDRGVTDTWTNLSSFPGSWISGSRLHIHNDITLKNPLEPISAFQRRISKLSLYVGYKQALHIALAERTNGDIRIHLFDKGRDVALRSGTSDMRCFEKIFLAEDYRTPFPVEAKVIVDAGANVGMATLYYSYAYPNARIIAI
jgi:hypothetical protein